MHCKTEGFINLTSVDFQSRFSPKLLTRVFSSSLTKIFLPMLENAIMNAFCCPRSGVVKEHKCLELLLVFTCFIIQTVFFSPTCSIYRQTVSWKFFLEGDCSFLHIEEFVLHNEIGTLIDQN